MIDILNAFVGLDNGTRVRTVTALITAILDFLSVFGIITFSDEQAQALQKIILVLVTGFVWAYCSHYKNNCNTVKNCELTGELRTEDEEEAGAFDD